MKKKHISTNQAAPASEQGKCVAPRRKFLTAAAVAGAAGATLGFPLIGRAQAPIKFRFQAGWPNKDAFYAYTQAFAAKVDAMSAGKLKFEVIPAGSVVKPFDMLDAVHSGTLDACHAACGYWYGKNQPTRCSAPGLRSAWTHKCCLGWVEQGGGKQLYDELISKVMKYNVKGMLHVPMWNQPLGWFRKEIKTPADIKGLKYRTIGLARDLMQEMGASVVMLAAADIIPALDRGVIDAAEFNNPSSDRTLGFPDVAKQCYCKASTSRWNAKRSSSTRKSSMPCPRSFRQSASMRRPHSPPRCGTRR